MASNGIEARRAELTSIKRKREERGNVEPHEPRYVRRSLINVDHARNVRNFGRPIEKEDPKTIKLCRLLARDGQLKPVTVIARTEVHESGAIYDLDTGYRRMTALDVLEIDTVFVSVVVVEEKEVDRISRVIGENEGHEPLTPAELAFACDALRQAARKDLTTMTTAEIADRIQRSESYVKELLNCVDHLCPSVMAAWKGERGAIPLPVSDAIRFAHMGRSRQEEEWKKYLGREGGGKTRGKRSGNSVGPRPSTRADIAIMIERAKTLTRLWRIDKYEVIKGAKNLRLARAVAVTLLAHVIDRDKAYPFK